MRCIRPMRLIGVLAAVGLVLPTTPVAAQHVSADMPAEQQVFMGQTGDEGDELRDYITIGPDGEPYFDRSAAETAGADEATLALGDTFNAYAAEMGSDEAEEALEAIPFGPYTETTPQQVYGKGLRIPIWGNWCGPGYGEGIPKDVLDSLCKQHDLCYVSEGYWNCQCDRDFIVGISKNLRRMGFRQRMTAIVIREFFRARHSLAC